MDSTSDNDTTLFGFIALMHTFVHSYFNQTYTNMGKGESESQKWKYYLYFQDAKRRSKPPEDVYTCAIHKTTNFKYDIYI